MMNKMFLTLLLVLVVVTALYQTPLAASGKKTKMIQWGGIPPLDYIRDNIREMEKIPFDGLILNLNSNDGRISASWNIFTPVALKEEDFSKEVAILKSIKFKRFTDNFLVIDITPCEIDWFDEDFKNAIANAALMGKIAKECRMKGIMFDIEQYTAHPFEYKTLPEKDKHTFVEYHAKVRERGREFMKALNASYPDIAVLTTFGYSISGGDSMGDRATRMYGLYAPFLDGMLDVAADKTTIYDGFEFAYGIKTQQEYENGQSYMLGIGELRTGNLKEYRKHYRSSFGIWTDNGRRWDPVDFNKNHFTPEEFGYALHNGLKYNDGYVWVYSEASKWWDYNGQRNVPQPYIDAVANARKPHPIAPPTRQLEPPKEAEPAK